MSGGLAGVWADGAFDDNCLACAASSVGYAATCVFMSGPLFDEPNPIALAPS